MKDQASASVRMQGDARAYCDGKLRLQSFTKADRMAKRQRKRYQSTSQVYHCAKCQGFHVGEVAAGKRENTRRRRLMEIAELEA